MSKGSGSHWSQGHVQRVWISLEADVLPYIGHFLITNISILEVLVVICKIEYRDALDLEGRILYGCPAISRFAIQ